MSTKSVTLNMIIGASPKECLEIMTDYESYPGWQPAIRKATVLAKDSRGRGKRVSFELSVLVKTIRYTLEYRYPDRGHSFSWESVAGDVKAIHGEYVFEKCDDGTTSTTYTQKVETGFWVPGKIQDFLSSVTMKQSLEALKHRAEEFTKLRKKPSHGPAHRKHEDEAKHTPHSMKEKEREIKKKKT